MKKLIFVAASVALLIVGIGAGAVLSTEKRVAHYGPNFVCLLNAEGAIECLGSDIFGVVSGCSRCERLYRDKRRRHIRLRLQ